MTLPWLTRKKPANAAELLHFTLPDAYAGQTVYNISVPFIDQERHVLWGRTEPLDSEHSDVLLFDLVTRSYVAGAPRLLQAQDAQYLGQFPDAAGRRWHVMVAVLVDIDADGRIRSYRDAFYRWQHSVHELSTGSEPQPFAHGPVGQKDTRLVLLRDSQGGPAGIGVCIRPQGVYGGRGQIGYLEIHHLDELEATLTRTFAQADPALLIPHVFARLYAAESWRTGAARTSSFRTRATPTGCTSLATTPRSAVIRAACKPHSVSTWACTPCLAVATAALSQHRQSLSPRASYLL